MLFIGETEICRNGPGRVLAVFWRQRRTERRLARRGIRFRDTHPERVAAAYAAMSAVEFDAINGLQDWANWRTIPRALSGHVPDRALRVLDLGCGTGGSTRVLAFYCPAGSHITGFEFAEPLLGFARRRDYRTRDGRAAQVEFVCQALSEILHHPDGSGIESESVDLVNASGVIGHHLNTHTVAPLVAEICRVLRADGVAMLDVGPTLSGGELRAIMAKADFDFLGHYRSWFADRTGELVFRRRVAERLGGR